MSDIEKSSVEIAKAVDDSGKDIANIAKDILTSPVFADEKETTIAKILLNSLRKSEDIYSYIQERIDKVDISTIEGQLVAGKLFSDLLDKQLRSNEQQIKAAETASKFLPKQPKTNIAVGQSVKSEDIFMSPNSISTDQFAEIIKRMDNENIDPIKTARPIEEQIIAVNGITDSGEDAFIISDDDDDDEEKADLGDFVKKEEDDLDIEIIWSPNTPSESI